jgi:hypothetical protein
VGCVLRHAYVKPPYEPLIDVSDVHTEATQGLLSGLRDETEALSKLQHGSKMESLFTGPIVCHMDSSRNPPHHGTTVGIKIVISHLATTRSAQTHAILSGLDFPEPGLDATQLDNFLDIAPRMRELQELNQIEAS